MLYEFHVRRAARDRYQFDQSLFALNGNVVFANFYAARVFAQRINQQRDVVRNPDSAVRASHLNALGLLHETAHAVFRAYRQRAGAPLLANALTFLATQVGPEPLDKTLRAFVAEFPPLPVYRGEVDAEAYLRGATDGTPHREAVLEEILLLWLANQNPAFTPFRELFDDASLAEGTAYHLLADRLYRFFAAQPAVAADGAAVPPGTPGAQNIIDVLLAPARAAPHSLEAQLEYVRGAWGALIGDIVLRLLGSLDMIKEEEKPGFVGDAGGGFGGGTPEFGFSFDGGPDAPASYPEVENFTQDKDWMPNLVLIAKNAYVWLDQLSKRYGRHIATLADIPDEELDALQRSGITGLWLIGLWERSVASRRIKQMMGNEDAVASAYSLYDYQIAQKLGGEPACDNLRQRAWRRGIRLSSDMVPNHVGIDGRWVIEHPDWFLSVPHPPYPAYSFNGPDLSTDARVGIFLEDHYYDRSDAAVVFRRVDRWSGDERFIYHGNDGTSLPWNDTAQLNYLSAEVREGVIQTILHVARQFPVIRFDAAMTLAKKHIQRLWFPEPGQGGAIASRSEHALTRAQFDALIPEEFWREVVDRCAVEAPDTLLLAEAFWMMESYFVRTLGMHRVYNSAFMHLLRDEDNARYRWVMKNTLEFDPEILKRYVNFMNNPDEKTAVEQFGKGDKYFGIATLMATMPGLPMIGHGQIEGFTEKYGMEYQRAYYDEQPDEYLIERHRREIFPLLHRRWLFAEVQHFLLYDFYNAEGGVNEDVFAYSNRSGDERSLVVCHNRYASARGWVRTSAAFMARTGNGDERAITQRSLGEGMQLPADAATFCIFRDHVSGLEYIRSSAELADKGMYVELHAYQYHVFLNWQIVPDAADGRYARVHTHLGGRGVPSVDEAMRELLLAPVRDPYAALVNGASLRELLTQAQSAERRAQPTGAAFAAGKTATGGAQPAASGEASSTEDATQGRLAALLEQIAKYRTEHGNGADSAAADAPDAAAVSTTIRARLDAALALIGDAMDATAVETARRVVSTDVADAAPAAGGQPSAAGDRGTAVEPPSAVGGQAAAPSVLDSDTARGTLLVWALTHHLGAAAAPAALAAEQSRSWIDEWLLGPIIRSALREINGDDGAAERGVALVKLLTAHAGRVAGDAPAGAEALLDALLADRDAQQFIGVNRYNDVVYFNKESFEQLVGWLEAAARALGAPADADAAFTQLRRASVESGYQLERLREVARAA
jgi:glycosidase